MNVESCLIDGVNHKSRLIPDVALVSGQHLLPYLLNELVQLYFASQDKIASREEGRECFIWLFGIVIVQFDCEIGLQSLMNFH